MMQKVAFNLRQASAAYGLSVSKLRKLIRAGALNPTRVGRRILLRASELERLLQAGEKQGM